MGRLAIRATPCPILNGPRRPKPSGPPTDTSIPSHSPQAKTRKADLRFLRLGPGPSAESGTADYQVVDWAAESWQKRETFLSRSGHIPSAHSMVCPCKVLRSIPRKSLPAQSEKGRSRWRPGACGHTQAMAQVDGRKRRVERGGGYLASISCGCLWSPARSLG